MRFSILLLLLFFSAPASAQSRGDIIIDMAQEKVDITSSFDGETITVFGSVNQQADVALVVRGPESRIVIRKKHPSLGIWLNSESVDFRRVPLFYHYALSRSENGLADIGTLSAYGIGLNALSFDAADYDRKKTNTSEFQEALIRTRQSQGLFPLMPMPVRFIGDRLFKASFYLPANVPVGHYQVNAYLFSNGRLIDNYQTGFDVGQAGLSADILNFAVDYSFAYAILGLLLAIGAGCWAFWMSRSQRT